MSENKEKNTNKSAIVLLLLIVVLGGIAAYLTFIKYSDTSSKSNSSSNPKEKNNKPVESWDLEENEIFEILDYTNKYCLFGLRNFDNKIVISKNNITNNMMLSMADYYLENYPHSDYGKYDLLDVRITKDVVNEYFKKAFGFTPSSYNDIRCNYDDKVLFKYNKDNEEYTYDDSQPIDHDSQNCIGIRNFKDYIIKSAQKQDDKYVIDAIFFYDEEGGGGYNVNDIYFETNLDRFASDEEFIKEFKERKSEFDSVTPFELVFTKNSGSYQLVSIEFKK